jgi:hypothetical protein
LGQVLKVLCTRFNAQGWKVIILVVQAGAIKLYVAIVEAFRQKKERQDETQFTTKTMVS